MEKKKNKVTIIKEESVDLPKEVSGYFKVPESWFEDVFIKDWNNTIKEYVKKMKDDDQEIRDATK